MLIQILTKINSLNEFIFAPVDNFIEKLPLADWALDAICDSIHLIPFLFFVFLLIEILEFYYADKINSALKKTGRGAVLVGALAAIFPQCGFSVIASSLYVKRIISIGTLIAVYLSTSDETIPILLATPSKAYMIIPIVGIKLFIAVLMGYFIDFVLGNRIQTVADSAVNQTEVGCCHHDIEHGSKRELIIHPILHTINIWGFILVITLILNYCLSNVEMMLIKGTISFGAVISGLLANSGLGLLVLLKNNDFKDTLRIIFILLLISIVSGMAINFFTGFY